MGNGTDAAIEASDLTLVRGDLRAVPDAILLSRRTLATIKGNLFWAFGYNAAAISLAALGFLNPLIAAAAMAFSSVFVVSNSLRLRRFHPRAPASPSLVRCWRGPARWLPALVRMGIARAAILPGRRPTQRLRRLRSLLLVCDPLRYFEGCGGRPCSSRGHWRATRRLPCRFRQQSPRGIDDLLDGRRMQSSAQGRLSLVRLGSRFPGSRSRRIGDAQ